MCSAVARSTVAASAISSCSSCCSDTWRGVEPRGDAGQIDFGRGQHRRQRLCHRQAAQRHQAVGLDLEQALRDAAGAAVAGAGGGNHEQALEAVVAQRKVGHGARVALGRMPAASAAGTHARSDHRGVAEPASR